VGGPPALGEDSGPRGCGMEGGYGLEIEGRAGQGGPIDELGQDGRKSVEVHGQS